MKIYAAMDLLDGQVVRLLKGSYEDVTTYGSPKWAVNLFKGFPFFGLHVVNLNGAKGEVLRNLDIIGNLTEQFEGIQVGGGLRTVGDCERMLLLKASPIVSTLAFEDPEDFKKMCTSYPGQISLSLDIKKGCIMTRGWLYASELTLETAIEQVASLPLKQIIVTNIEGDGTLNGVDMDFFNWAYTLIRSNSSIPVLAAGGISSPADVSKLEALGYEGAIIGKAIYEKGTQQLWSKGE